MPALNTPQFGWSKSRMPRHAQPVPPIYQPEVGARAIVWAARHPSRREVRVGASTSVAVVGNKIAPSVGDRFLARTGYRSQQTNGLVEPNRPDNLFRPLDADRDAGAHGAFDKRAHRVSAQLWATTHRTLALLAGMAVVMAFVGGWWRTKH
jgi:hypothetical protein